MGGVDVTNITDNLINFINPTAAVKCGDPVLSHFLVHYIHTGTQHTLTVYQHGSTIVGDVAMPLKHCPMNCATLSTVIRGLDSSSFAVCGAFTSTPSRRQTCRIQGKS